MKETHCNICGSTYMYESDRIECEVQDWREAHYTNQVAQEVLVGNSYSVCSGCKYRKDDIEGCEWENEESAHYAEHFCYEFEQDAAAIEELLEIAWEAAEENDGRNF